MKMPARKPVARQTEGSAARPKAAPSTDGFSPQDIDAILRDGRALFAAADQLKIDRSARVVLIVGRQNIEVRAITGLTSTIKRRGGGALLWETEASGPELKAGYIDFLRSKVGVCPIIADFEDLSWAVPTLFVSADVLFACLYTSDAQVEKCSPQSLEGPINFSLLACVTDILQQLSLLTESDNANRARALHQKADAFLQQALPMVSAERRSPLVDLLLHSINLLDKGEDAKLAKIVAVASGHMIAAKKYEIDLPQLPPELSWPTEVFSASPEAKQKHGIIPYLERVWGDIIRTGLIHRGHIGVWDSAAAEEVHKYTYNKGRTKRLLPTSLPLQPQRKRQPSPERGTTSAPVLG